MDTRYVHSCGRKQRHSSNAATEIAAKISRKTGENIRAYPCGFCLGWHVGHSRPVQPTESEAISEIGMEILKCIRSTRRVDALGWAKYSNQKLTAKQRRHLRVLLKSGLIVSRMSGWYEITKDGRKVLGINNKVSTTYQDGELLKCIGAPLNGQLRRISFPMPSILCPNAGFQLAAGDRYERDDEKRAWVWKGKPCTSK